VDGIPKLRVRIETLSDLVFGLALSIGSIALVQHIPQNSADLSTDIVQFGFSFLIVVGIWLGYTRIIGILPVETQGTVFLNLGLLFCVALEPFLYYVLFSTSATSDPTFLDFASSAFGLDTGAMMALLSSMMYLVVRQEEHGGVRRLRPIGLRNFKVSMVSQIVGAAIFLASTLEVFWVQVPNLGYLRFLLWYVALGTFFASRAFARKGAQNLETAKH
jgi:uncharacterized membrane protein